MLTEIIRRPDFLAKYRATFRCAYIDEFVAQFLDRGYTRESTKWILRDAREFVEWGAARGLDISELDDDALAKFARRNQRRHRHKLAVRRQTNARHLIQFLRAKRIVAPAPPPPAMPLALAEFADWMLEERGARQATVRLYVTILRERIFSKLNIGARLEARSLRASVRACSRGYGVDFIQCIVNAARAFVRFSATRGRCPMKLVAAIPRVARWRLASLPRHVPAVDVERIIRACDRSKPSGRRDRAILLLLARLGLRASDVAQLSFDAIDWTVGRLRVTGKGRREDWLPLPQDVGDALLEYLKTVRPKHASPRVFLTARAPVRSLSAGRVSTLCGVAIGRSGVHAPVRGAHLFRHSVAVALLHQGLGLSQIAALLRHTSIDTTSIYAKVDMPLLSLVAAPWPRISSRAPRDHELARDDLRGVAACWPIGAQS